MVQFVVGVCPRTRLAGAVAAHHGDLRRRSHHGHALDLGHFLHHLLTAHGAIQPVERLSLKARVGKAAAARESAATAVGARQGFLYLPDARIFMHLEFLRYRK